MQVTDYVKLAMIRSIEVQIVCPDCQVVVAVTTEKVKPSGLGMDEVIKCRNGHPMRLPEDKRADLFRLRRV